VKLSALDTDLLLILFNYLEAKQDLNSIGMAIDLHINNRNYKRAIELYERYSKVKLFENDNSNNLNLLNFYLISK
jgi:hypothetical protein